MSHRAAPDEAPQMCAKPFRLSRPSQPQTDWTLPGGGIERYRDV